MTTYALCDANLVTEARALPIEEVTLSHVDRRYWPDVFNADTVTMSRGDDTRVLKPKAFKL